MAINPQTNFYHWYRRYLVTASDLSIFQATLRDQIFGRAQGLAAGSVWSGFDVTPNGTEVIVQPGVACAPSGYFLAATGQTPLAMPAAPASGDGQNYLVVARPNPTPANYIQSPTQPSQQVPLWDQQLTEIVMLTGAAAPTGTQEYPTPATGDVVLAGIRYPSGATGVSQSMIDYVVRDRLGDGLNLAALSPYDYIVGLANPMRTHASIVDLANDSSVQPGSRVLMDQSEALYVPAQLNVPELVIEFAPGTELTSAGAATGIIMAATGITLIKPRVIGFSSVAISASAEFCAVERGRFDSSVPVQVDDSLTQYGCVNLGPITEY